jgi:hypothetical protein
MPRPTLIWTLLACLVQAGAMQAYGQASFRRSIGTQPFPQQFVQVMRQADGNLVGGGYYTTNVFINYPLLSAFTPGGIQRWSLRFGPGDNPRTQLGEVTALARTASGDILAAGFINTNKNADIQYPYEDAFVARVSANGDVQWLFTYDRNKGTCIRENLFRPAHIAEMPGGDIIVAADMQDCTEQAQYLVLFRLDANGGVTWTSSYQYPLGLSVRSGMTVDGRGIILWTGRALTGTGNRYVLEQLRFDPATGNLAGQKSWEIDPQGFDPAMTIGGQLLRSRQLSNGHTLLIGSTRSAFQFNAGTSPVFSVLEFNAQDQFVRGYHISPSIADAGTLMLNITADEHGLVLFNRMYKRTATRQSMALATMQDGQLIHQRRLDDLRAYLANPEPLEILQDRSLILLNAYDRVIDFYRLQHSDRDTGCLGRTVPAQDLFRIAPVTYRAVQAPPIQAYADTIFATNDGFYAEKDEAAPEGNRLELGPGLVLCPGKTATLKAPDGFSAYIWSNGQSGQEITVSQPGIYACTAIDFCGLSYTDSLQVSDASSVPLVVESSKTICPGAEVRFEALPGFSEYRWSPSYRMVTNPGTAVMVANPLPAAGQASQWLCADGYRAGIDGQSAHRIPGPRPVYLRGRQYPAGTARGTGEPSLGQWRHCTGTVGA